MASPQKPEHNLAALTLSGTRRTTWPSGSGSTYDENVRDYSGSLPDRIDAALTALPSNQGTVVVPQTSDGSAWTWDRTLTLDPDDLGGAEIRIGHNVLIDCQPGTGNWTLVLDTGGDLNGDGRNLKLVGGRWRHGSSGAIAGWCQLRDAIQCELRPNDVRDVYDGTGFGDTSGTAKCIELRNVDNWCEANIISGYYGGDRFLDTVPASVTGGTGTDSFHDNVVTQVSMNINDYGSRWTGNCKGVTVENYTCFGEADGAAAFQFGNPQGTRWRGMQIKDGKMEGPGTNKRAFALESDYTDFQAPVVTNFDIGAITPVESADGTSDDRVVPGIREHDSGIRMGGYGGSYLAWYATDDYGNIPALSSVPSALAQGREDGDFYIDDGTNTSSGNPALRIWVNGSWHDMN